MNSFINWESQNREVRKSFLLPSVVDLSPSDTLFDLALKSRMTVVRKRLLLKESSKFISTIMFIKFGNFLMVEGIFFLPQVKQNVIIRIKWYVRVVSRLKIEDLSMLRNISKISKEISAKSLVLSPPLEMKILSVLVKISWTTEIELFP